MLVDKPSNTTIAIIKANRGNVRGNAIVSAPIPAPPHGLGVARSKFEDIFAGTCSEL